MTFARDDADLFIPDGLAETEALARTTHLGIGAHPDDLEFMALHGIQACYSTQDEWFGGVTCTDGAGCARSGPFADYTDAQMAVARAQEQREAATIGQYAFMAQLGHPSRATKDPFMRTALQSDLVDVLKWTRPQVVYTHNPFDSHDTHVGVLYAVLEAVRALPLEERPRRLLGCEVWRGLDWLPSVWKVRQPLDVHPELAAALNAAFKSQIAGGKRYDLAVEGRRLAHATFSESHAVDTCRSMALAVDLTPLLADDALTLETFSREVLDAFRTEVTSLQSRLKSSS